MIKDTLKIAIRSLSNKHKVDEKDLRICISRPESNLKYEIMKNGDVYVPGELRTHWRVYYRQVRTSPETTG